MLKAINQPYVKQYDEKGILTNPITKAKPYLSTGPNRSSRRASMQKDRFLNNRKTYPLVVAGMYRYFKQLQAAIDNATGKVKYIEHYRPAGALIGKKKPGEKK